MGNDPGKPLDTDKETSRIVIDIKGPFKDKNPADFKKDLMELLEKYKGKWGSYDLPIKK